MDHSKFWQIIELAKKASGSDGERQLNIIRNELTELAPEEIIAFDEIMDEYLAKSYRNDLWAAAYIINGGCSDDGFYYFRAWLIAQGRTVFEEALQNPESLSDDVVMDPNWEAELEEFLYVARQAYTQKTMKEMPFHPYPFSELTGLKWNEDSVYQLFPELTRVSDARFAGNK